VGFYRYFCRASTRALIGVFLIASFFTSPAYSLDTKDSQLFITGFNAYLKRDYPEAIANLSGVLEQYPDTSLRDMAILWLSRSYYKAGNQKDAARYMAQFFKEYPESPLKGTVEDELAELAVKYQKGESLTTQQAAKTTAAPPVAAVVPATISTDKQVIAKQDETARVAAEKADKERAAAAKAEAERQETEKLALAKAETDRQAAEKLALAKAEAERQEKEKLALAKAETDRQAAEKLALDKAEAERQEKEKLALAKAEADRQAAEKLFYAKSAADRQAAEKLAQTKAEAERQETEKLALAKAETDRQAAEKLAQAKAVFITGFNAYLRGDYPEATANLSGVLEKYPDTSLRDMALLWLSRSYYKSGNQQEAGRYMAQFFKEYPESPLKATVEDDLADLAGKYQRGEPLAVQQAARTGAATSVVPVESGTIGTDKQAIAHQNEAVRIAAEKAARDKAEQEWAVAAKAEADRQAAEKLAQAKSAAEQKVSPAAAKQSKVKVSQSKRLRDQAIAEYKTIVDRYPGTPAAANATIRLRELDALQQGKADTVAVALVHPEENSNIFSIEVDQKASLEFSLAAEAQTVEIGKRFSVPFEVLNRGNSPDSFNLESGLPADYRPRFVAEAAPDLPLVKTSQLLPGERFKGLIQFEMPTISLDGERKLFPVKAHSDADGSISQSRPLRLLAKAPILRAVIKSDIAQAAPGERIPYRLALLNVGSSIAREVSLRVTFPPQYEPVDSAASGFSLEGNNALVISGLQLNQGDRREIAVTMQLKDSALAKEELFLHVDMINTVLNRTDTFVSAPVAVKAVSGVKMLANVEKIIAVPGQTVPVLLAVTNTGNASDEFTLKPTLASNLNYSFYLDSNRDGIRQSGETIVSHVGPLAPGEVVNLILEITTSSAEKDGAAVPLLIALDSQNDPSRRASAKLNLIYSRPVLSLTVAGKGGKIKPGEVNSFELVCINAGSSMAKLVEIRSSLPDQLELVADEPGNANKNNGEYAWRFDELGSGEKRTVRVSYRIKSGTAVGTALALKNILKYQDQLGNSY
jgi:outer membrane protein assembly factor BamD (BamD/ComL family)